MVQKTEHRNYPDMSLRVYCHKYDELVSLTTEYFQKKCFSCQYYAGDILGNGVECSFYDGSGKQYVAFHDCGDSEKYCKYVSVRTGLLTRESVDASLKGYSDLSDEELDLSNKEE